MATVSVTCFKTKGFPLLPEITIKNEERKVVVRRVPPGGKFAAAGVEEGDVINTVNQKSFTGLDNNQVFKALSKITGEVKIIFSKTSHCETIKEEECPAEVKEKVPESAPASRKNPPRSVRESVIETADTEKQKEIKTVKSIQKALGNVSNITKLPKETPAFLCDICPEKRSFKAQKYLKAHKRRTHKFVKENPAAADPNKKKDLNKSNEEKEQEMQEQIKLLNPFTQSIPAAEPAAQAQESTAPAIENENGGKHIVDKLKSDPEPKSDSKKKFEPKPNSDPKPRPNSEPKLSLAELEQLRDQVSKARPPTRKLPPGPPRGPPGPPGPVIDLVTEDEKMEEAKEENENSKKIQNELDILKNLLIVQSKENELLQSSLSQLKKKRETSGKFQDAAQLQSLVEVAVKQAEKDKNSATQERKKVNELKEEIKKFKKKQTELIRKLNESEERNALTETKELEKSKETEKEQNELKNEIEILTLKNIKLTKSSSEQLLKEKEICKKKIHAKLEELKELRSEKNNQKKKVSELEKNIVSFKTDVGEFQARLEKVQQENENNSNEKVSNLQALLNQQEEKLQTLKDKNSKYKHQYSSLLKEIEALKKDKKEIAETYENATKEMHEKLKSTKNSVDLKSEMINRLELENRKLLKEKLENLPLEEEKKKTRMLEDALKVEERRSREMAEKLRSSNSKLDESNFKIVQIEKKIKGVEASNESNLNKLLSLQVENTELKTNTAEKSLSKEVTRNFEFTILKAENEEFKKKQCKLEEKNVELTAKCNEIDKVNLEYEAAKLSVTVLEGKNQKLETKNQDTKAALALLKRKYSKLESSEKELNKDVSEKSKDLSDVSDNNGETPEEEERRIAEQKVRASRDPRKRNGFSIKRSLDSIEPDLDQENQRKYHRREERKGRDERDMDFRRSSGYEYPEARKRSGSRYSLEKEETRRQSLLRRAGRREKLGRDQRRRMMEKYPDTRKMEKYPDTRRNEEYSDNRKLGEYPDTTRTEKNHETRSLRREERKSSIPVEKLNIANSVQRISSVPTVDEPTTSKVNQRENEPIASIDLKRKTNRVVEKAKKPNLGFKHTFNFLGRKSPRSLL